MVASIFTGDHRVESVGNCFDMFCTPPLQKIEHFVPEVQKPWTTSRMEPAISRWAGDMSQNENPTKTGLRLCVWGSFGIFLWPRYIFIDYIHNMILSLID